MASMANKVKRIIHRTAEVIILTAAREWIAMAAAMEVTKVVATAAAAVTTVVAGTAVETVAAVAESEADIIRILPFFRGFENANIGKLWAL